MNNYKLGSLFDGSGGFPLAGALCGIDPVWAAEVEPYPIAVTRERFDGNADSPFLKIARKYAPSMKLYMMHLGDISKVNGAEIEPVDIITFGSPCQDLSVAGKRAGLKHEANGDEETTRSGLFMEAVRIIKEMRKATNGEYPRFAIWENVPGAFSSNNGEDFRIVCEELIKIVEPSAFMPEVPKNGWNYADSFVGDGWSLAYRVFDAQYWGVPQRRRRIYLVADFRGECAREVLFEREGLRGYFTQGRTPWQAAPAHAEGSLGADDRAGDSCGGGQGAGDRGLDAVGFINAIGGNAENSRETQTAPTLTNGSAPGFQNAVAYRTTDPTFIIDNVGGQAEYAKASEVNGTLRAGAQGLVAYAVENHPADSRVNIDESGKCQTLTSRMGTGGGNVPMVMEQTPFCKSGRARSAEDATTWKEGKVANTLNTFDQGETRANELVVAFAQNQREEVRDLGGVAVTLNAEPGTHQQTFVAEGKPVYCLQGNGIDRADTAGCNGKGVKEDICYTLNTIDRPAVAYSFDSLASNSMKSSNPHSGCREVEVAKTLDTSDPNPSKNQGGIAVVQPAYGLDRASFNQGQNAKFDFTISEEQQPTLTARGPGAVVHASKASFFTRGAEGAADTLVATDYKDPQIVAYAESGTNGSKVSNTLVASMGNAPTGTTQDNVFVRTNYIVRRLTPTECARLQGFADRWGWIEEKKALTEEEYKFWMEVRNTHARINGKKEQEYTEKQMLAWYNKLWTDSAEYKMWGNGIALPTALYCIQGMAEVLARPVVIEDDDDWMN